MYELRDEDEGGNGFSFSSQGPSECLLGGEKKRKKEKEKFTQCEEPWQYLDHLESLWVITQKLLTTAF